MPLGLVGSQVTPAKICPQVLLRLGVSIGFKFLGLPQTKKKGCGRVDNVVRKQDGILMIGGGGLSESNNTTDIMYKRDQWERDLSTPLDD